MSDGEYIGQNDQGLRMVFYHTGERFIDLDRRPCLVGAQCQLQLVGCVLTLLVLQFLIAIRRIIQDRNAGERRQKLLEQLQPFTRQLWRDAGQPSRLTDGSRDAHDKAFKRIAANTMIGIVSVASLAARNP